MPWREEAQRGLPAHRQDEPRNLRQDILDELSDHLALAAERERQQGVEDETLIWSRVMERFGDPTAVARKLWFQSMKGAIMRQWIQTALMGVFAAAILVMTVMMYKQLQMTNKVVSDVLASRSTDAGAMLATLQLALNRGAPEGPPAEGIGVFLDGKAFNEDKTTFREWTGEDGLFECGPIRPGQYNLSLTDEASFMSFKDRITLFAGQGVVEKKVTAPPLAQGRLRFHVDWPDLCRALPEDTLSNAFMINMAMHWSDGNPPSWTAERRILVAVQGLKWDRSRDLGDFQDTLTVPAIPDIEFMPIAVFMAEVLRRSEDSEKRPNWTIPIPPQGGPFEAPKSRQERHPKGRETGSSFRVVADTDMKEGETVDLEIEMSDPLRTWLEEDARRIWNETCVPSPGHWDYLLWRDYKDMAIIEAHALERLSPMEGNEVLVATEAVPPLAMDGFAPVMLGLPAGFPPPTDETVRIVLAFSIHVTFAIRPNRENTRRPLPSSALPPEGMIAVRAVLDDPEGGDNVLLSKPLCDCLAVSKVNWGGSPLPVLIDLTEAFRSRSDASSIRGLQIEWKPDREDEGDTLTFVPSGCEETPEWSWPLIAALGEVKDVMLAGE